jgi:hypothetical protein
MVNGQLFLTVNVRAAVDEAETAMTARTARNCMAGDEEWRGG